MSAFQNTHTGLYLRRASSTDSEWVKLLADSAQRAREISAIANSNQ